MLLNYSFLVDNLDVSILEEMQDAHYEFIIPLASKDINEKRSIFYELSKCPHQFCFILTRELVDNNSSETLVNFLLPFLFLTNYMKYKGRHLLVIEACQQSDQEGNKEPDFYNEINRQLTKEIIIDHLKMSSCIITPETNETFVYNAELIRVLLQFETPNSIGSNQTINFLSFSFGQKIIIPVSSSKDFFNQCKAIRNFESWLSNNQPVLTKIAGMFNKVVRRECDLNDENGILKTKLNNSYQNIKVLRENSLWYVHEYDRLNSRNQYDGVNSLHQSDLLEKVQVLSGQVERWQNKSNAIQEWYGKEYEVLPRWYKQLGHIIKVIAGKRTFKSLFK